MADMSDTPENRSPGRSDSRPERLGTYRVEKLIGEGGMGRVYQALDEALNRRVALKTLLPTLAADPEFVARFKREAQSAAALNHPNITQLYAIGQEGAVPFFAMELIEGESLEAKVKKNGPIDPLEATGYILQAAAGLRHAAQKGLIHRDVKPSNLMLSHDGVVKITDFGLAKASRADTQLTATGEVLGSPGYISPEQAQGEPLDARSDIYALGATFYHLVIGRMPFDAPSAVALIMKHLNEPLRPPCVINPAIPYPLGAAIQRMMAKRPGERFQDYDVLIEELERVSGRRHGATAPRPRTAISGAEGRRTPVPGTVTSGRNRPVTRRAPSVEPEETSRTNVWLPIAVVMTLAIAATAALNRQSGEEPRPTSPMVALADESNAAQDSPLSSLGMLPHSPPPVRDSAQRGRETIRERIGQRRPTRAVSDLVILETDHEQLPDGRLEVTGEVRNNGALGAFGVRVRVRILSFDGRIVAREETMLQPPSLAPGDTARFRAVLDYDGPVGTINAELIWSQ
jgi:serine/threonine protein kinase